MTLTGPGTVISTILRHDSKVTSYKIALLRSINDIVLSFPDIRNHGLDVAIPLRLLAEFWLAYYWPFVDPGNPIMQGPRSRRRGKLSNDMAFRDELTSFRDRWQNVWGGISNPADGFLVINEFKVPRRRAHYSHMVHEYDQVLRRIARTIEMPIRYAGPGEWTIFEKPARLSRLQDVVAVPGSHDNDLCLVVSADLWTTFRELSLWVEALCIHEWALFTEAVRQPENARIDRGVAYTLLTARPDNRRPLTWERNNIDVLLMEGYEFICPWTEKRITHHRPYDLDHLVPVSVYPINELWNLVPADPDFNSHTKRDRLPSPGKLARAVPHLALAYTNYLASEPLAHVLEEDAAGRFSSIRMDDLPGTLTEAVTDFITSVAETRNLARF